MLPLFLNALSSKAVELRLRLATNPVSLPPPLEPQFLFVYSYGNMLAFIAKDTSVNLQVAELE